MVIEGRGADGWVPVSASLSGYVSANYLTFCGSVAETDLLSAQTEVIGSQCREVMPANGLNVRIQPERYSQRLIALPGGTNAQVTATETDHWVMIDTPVEGYVAKRFLGACC